jgi:GxxExxY protein
LVDDTYKFADITEKIIGCAMRVHSTLGNGFQEVVYQRCLAIEFDESGLSHKREIEMPLFYHGQDVGTRRVDFFVEAKVLVELKAVAELNTVHYAQMINYLEAYRIEVGLLLNFGEKSLKFKRFVKSAKSIHP